MTSRKFKQFKTLFILPLCITILTTQTMPLMLLTILYVSDADVHRIIGNALSMHPTPFWPIAFTLVLFLSSYIAIRISLHIQQKSFDILKEGIESLAEGKFDTRIVMNQSAPEEMDVLAEDLNCLAQELSSTEVLRMDFINTFSHEFKTPITSIRGFALLLQSGELDGAEQKEYLGIIVSESDRLSRLSQNVLLLSKLDAQSIVTNHEQVHLAEQIRRVILKREPLWLDKGLKFEMDVEEFFFLGNQELLEHLFSNLVDNAIKFSPTHGEIRIQLHQCNANVVFSITDYGCGMDAHTKHHIFEKFYQGDVSRATSGNGIGLAVAKRVVDQHDGTIQVHSVVGEGSTFTVTLPIKSNIQSN